MIGANVDQLAYEQRSIRLFCKILRIVLLVVKEFATMKNIAYNAETYSQNN